MTTNKRTTPKKAAPAKGAAIYHVMKASEGFDKTARILCELVVETQRKFPDQPRRLYLDIDGHRNSAGGLDHDAWELVGPFFNDMVAPFLSEWSHPLGHHKNPAQRNDPAPLGQISNPEVTS